MKLAFVLVSLLEESIAWNNFAITKSEQLDPLFKDIAYLLDKYTITFFVSLLVRIYINFFCIFICIYVFYYKTYWEIKASRFYDTHTMMNDILNKRSFIYSFYLVRKNNNYVILPMASLKAWCRCICYFQKIGKCIHS